MRNLILILTTLLLCSCARFAAGDPSAQFVRTYKHAFDSADTNALLASVKWGGMAEELRSGMIWKLTNHLGEQRITETALLSFDTGATVPSNQDGRKLIANLPSKFWLDVKSESTKGTSKKYSVTSTQFLLGVEDGRYYICGFRFAEP